MAARAPKEIIRTLEVAVEKLKRLTDESENASKCHIATEHKNAVRPYVDSWILPNVEAALAWAKGELGRVNDIGTWLGDTNL